MKTQRTDVWTRKGFSLLWDVRSLTRIAAADNVVSLREFFAFRDAWPEDLPSANGKALVVAGLDGCLDALSDSDGEKWLRGDIKNAVLSFQVNYENQAALIFWLPGGRRRIEMDAATEQYFRNPYAHSGRGRIPLGQHLWGGAANDVERILDSDQPGVDPEGDAWVGLYQPRIS
ncbi:MAG: hypothetical protein IT452_13725 [Planctomycetia bacterium]|nr:hypothetical protein [Planctomycetia bacterium]